MKTALVTLKARVSLLRNKKQALLHALARRAADECSPVERAHRLRQLAEEDRLLGALDHLACHADALCGCAEALYVAERMRPEWRVPLASLVLAASTALGDALPELAAVRREAQLLYGDGYAESSAASASQAVAELLLPVELTEEVTAEVTKKYGVVAVADSSPCEPENEDLPVRVYRRKKAEDAAGWWCFAR